MRDRAWPFPNKDIDTTTCERTQGYYIGCAELWQQKQHLAAAMSAVACLSNWFLVVGGVEH